MEEADVSLYTEQRPAGDISQVSQVKIMIIRSVKFQTTSSWYQTVSKKQLSPIATKTPKKWERGRRFY